VGDAPAVLFVLEAVDDLLGLTVRTAGSTGDDSGGPAAEMLFELGRTYETAWDLLRLAAASRVKPRCLAIKSVLVLPEYWGSGALLLLIDEMVRRARARGYEWIDLSLTSADNPYTPYLAERFGARVYKRYRLYQRAVDRPARPD